MSDHYLLPGEFFSLVLAASLPAWLLATIVQITIYKRKNLQLRKHIFVLVASLIVSFLVIVILGTAIWSVMPQWWFKLVAALLPIESFLSVYLGVMFPPFALAAALSAPVISYMYISRKR